MSGSGSARSERLGRLATDGGQFAILALDHVRSFATTLRPDDPDSLTPGQMLATKERLIEGLGGQASAVLIDPALAISRAAGARQLSAGLIVGIEDGDYAEAAISPRFLPGWSVERAARLGADGVKISFVFDPDGDAGPPERFVREVVRQCEIADVPLFCEPLTDVRGPDARRRVLEGVRRFGALGADVLKIQFPGDPSSEPSRDAWAEACAEADALTPSPWVLLSEGRDFDEFLELLTTACAAGASGFMAGRAIWGDALVSEGTEPAATRLRSLRAIAVEHGRSWRGRGADTARGDAR